MRRAKPPEARNSLFIGLISTALLAYLAVSIPEHIWEQIPAILIPLVYTAIVYFLIERFQGKALSAHKEMKHPFYSVWRAVGVGLLCALLYTGVFMFFLYHQPPGFDTEKYDKGVAELLRNEDIVRHFFEIEESAAPAKKIEYIEEVAIPACQNSLVILDELDEIEDLAKPLLKQNHLFRQYLLTMIEVLELTRKGIYEQTDHYEPAIQELFAEMVRILDQI